MREGRIVAPTSDVLDRLAGLELTSVRVDHQTRLQLDEFEIAISSPFRMTARDASVINVDPGKRVSLGPVVGLCPDALVAAAVDTDASLRLAFASGATVVVPADSAFEAWQVSGPNGLLVVCPPGGTGLAVWGGSK